MFLKASKHDPISLKFFSVSLQHEGYYTSAKSQLNISLEIRKGDGNFEYITIKSILFRIENLIIKKMTQMI